MHVQAARADACRMKGQHQQRNRPDFTCRPQQVQRVGIRIRDEVLGGGQERIREPVFRGDDDNESALGIFGEQPRDESGGAPECLRSREHRATDLDDGQWALSTCHDQASRIRARNVSQPAARSSSRKASAIRVWRGVVRQEPAGRRVTSAF